MAIQAQYAATPRFGSALLTTADTSLTAPTTVGTVLTAGASGTRIDKIEVQGVATTVASLINLFIHDGTNFILWTQVPLQANTVSNTVPASTVALSSDVNADILPLVLPTGHSLRATTSVVQTGVRVMAFGGDF